MLACSEFISLRISKAPRQRLGEQLGMTHSAVTQIQAPAQSESQSNGK